MRLVDEASAVANGDAAAGRIHGRRARARSAATALVLALAGCAAPPGTPSLHEVPERPRLLPAAERTAIAETVRSEGLAAWGEAQALRTRTGKSALPPPAWLLEPIRRPTPPGPTTTRPPNPEAAIVAERVRSESDDGSLNSFLRQLVRRQPGGPVIEVAADEPPVEPAGGGGQRTRPTPDDPALDRFLDHLGGRLAVGRPERAPDVPAAPETGAPAAPAQPGLPAAAPGPAATAAGPSPAAPPAPPGAPAPASRPAPPAKAAVAPGPARPPVAKPEVGPAPAGPAPAAPAREPPAASLPPPSPAGTLPTTARAELERVVELARRQGAGLEVVGHAAAPALALERARRVARLVAEELGVPPGGLSVRAAGAGERVELYLVPRPPS